MIYLDNAATSKFKPQSCIDAMTYYLKNSANYSRATHSQACEIFNKVLQFRKYIKETTNACNLNKIIFTHNCTDALNMAILGHAKLYKKPIHIITSAFDHNSTLRPIHYLYKENKAYMSVIYPKKDLTISVDEIYKSITPNTKMIIINHMSNVISSKIDLNKLIDISMQKKVHLIVDSAQSFGHEFIDTKNISALAIAPHKGLHAPQGVGILILNETMEIEPIKFGGSGINSEWLDQPKIYPDGFEVGTQNAPCILATFESYKYTYENSKNINKKIETLSFYLHQKLKEIKDIKTIGEGATFLILHKNAAQEDLFDFLNKNGICARFGLHCAPLAHSALSTLKSGATRISIGYNNNLNEMDEFISILRAFNKIYKL